MKISKATLDILKNFGSIKDTMVIQKGKTQRVSDKGPFLAQAEFDEDFPQMCGILSLKEFLAIVSLFDDPDFSFSNEYITIQEGKQKVDFRVFDLNMPSFAQVIPFDKKVNPTSLDVDFLLERANLIRLKKAANLLSAEHITIKGDGSVLTINSINTKDKTASKYNFDIGTTDKTFEMIIPMSKLIMLDHDYRIQISKTRLIQFISQNANLMYIFTADAKSTFS